MYINWTEPRVGFLDECYHMVNGTALRMSEKDLEDNLWVPPVGLDHVMNAKARHSLRSE